MRAVIIGASGGIGAALVEQLAARDDYNQVYALSRSGAGAGRKTVSLSIDLEAEDSIAAAAKTIAAEGAPDLVIVASGILSDQQGLAPEKSLRQQSTEAFQKVLAINTIGPSLIAKHFLPIMPRKERAVFAAISARVGSISDNRIGGWHAYRASKAAAVNLGRNLAVDLEPLGIALGVYHPGWVRTDMGGAGADISDAESADGLVQEFAKLSLETTGCFKNYDGEDVPL